MIANLLHQDPVDLQPYTKGKRQALYANTPSENTKHQDKLTHRK